MPWNVVITKQDKTKLDVSVNQENVDWVKEQLRAAQPATFLCFSDRMEVSYFIRLTEVNFVRVKETDT